MKNFTIFLFLLSLLTLSCNSGINRIFGSNKTAHEKYEEKLNDLDLDETPAGQAWKAASLKALSQPLSIQLPFSMQGQFPADKPRAIGLEFQAKKGEQVRVEWQGRKPVDFILYADLFEKTTGETSHVFSAKPDSSHFLVDIESSGFYILRLQPRLSQTGQYSVILTTGPSLGFPVSDKKARVGSFWGDDRDGGKRRHEGIDIFAPKKSPAVAAADGYITTVDEGGLGGKTVWLRPAGKNYSLYYAHLDEQLVSPGQYVKKGQTVGLVGNTGNAQHTPAHLHFGIYTHGGAVDPFPFVKKADKATTLITGKDLNVQLQLVKAQFRGSSSIPANAILHPLGITAKGYIIESPDGGLVQIANASVKTKSLKVKESAIATTAEQPSKKSNGSSAL